MSNPYQTPETPTPANNINGVHLAAYLLLFIPPALCYGIMHLAEFIPAGPRWGLLQLLMLTVIPLGSAIASGSLVAQVLSNGSKWRQIVFCCLQFPFIFYVWQQTCQVLVTGWH